METRKIALSCFIGGVLTTIAALLLAPNFWWLGLMAGIAGGYLSYEFREMVRVFILVFSDIPKAVGRMPACFWHSRMRHNVHEWFCQPHPFFYGALVLGLIVGACVGSTLELYTNTEKAVFFGIEIAMFTIVIMIPMLHFFARSGIKGEPYYWVRGNSFTEYSYWYKENSTDKRERRYDHINQIQPTYRQVYCWIARGAWMDIKRFTRPIYKVPFTCVVFLGNLVWLFLKTIHSHKRLLCAIDGTLGGAMSYIWLAIGSMTFAEEILIVVCGGLLGAALGIINWELISKRVFHISVQNAK